MRLVQLHVDNTQGQRTHKENTCGSASYMIILASSDKVAYLPTLMRVFSRPMNARAAKLKNLCPQGGGGGAAQLSFSSNFWPVVPFQFAG